MHVVHANQAYEYDTSTGWYAYLSKHLITRNICISTVEYSLQISIFDTRFSESIISLDCIAESSIEFDLI